MKTLGLLGGMTWHSTVDYYRLINEGVHARLGGVHSAEIVMYSVDFAPVEVLQDEGRWEEMGRLMAAGAVRLAGAGAEAVVLCTNTMHRLAGDISAAVRIPLLITQRDTDIPVFDTTALHAAAAVDFALS